MAPGCRLNRRPRSSSKARTAAYRSRIEDSSIINILYTVCHSSGIPAPADPSKNHHIDSPIPARRLSRDYDNTKAIIFGGAPEFEEILASVGEIERIANMGNIAAGFR